MKKLLLLVATAAGAVFVRNKMQQDAADQKLWAEATKDASTRPTGGNAAE